MSILDRILDDTRELVEKRKRETPISDLESRPIFSQERTSFYEPLCEDELSIIAEVKKASPSKGVIRENFDAAKIAQQYDKNGAAAISVLTEPQHFQGDIAFLPWIRAHGVKRPLLRKDFIIDEYQLVEARAFGADAVLLIATALEAGQLYDLHQAADALGLDCLVEVYGVEDLDKIDFHQVKILGANNRNLSTFEVDLNQSIRVFRRAPDHVVRVSESGLSTAKELAIMRQHGVDAVLIGESLMRADDPGAALRTLKDELNEALAAA